MVGLVAPSGVTNEAQIERGIANLKSLGLEPRLARNLRAARGGYAGTVAQRVDDLHAMFRDPDVRAVWTARGGSGSSALLPHVDYDLVRANPKILVGFSDTCALQLALLRRSGLVTFHGPVSSSTFSEFSSAQLRAVVFDGATPSFALPVAMEQPRVLRPGRAEGPLLGGNLTVLCSLLGTPYMPDAGGALLFLEDVGEAPYRIDRMLVQLEQAGVTASASGVALGVFRKCDPTDDEPSLTLREVFEDRFSARRTPCGWGFPFGHIREQLTLPYGVRARMDTANGELVLLEPAVGER